MNAFEGKGGVTDYLPLIDTDCLRLHWCTNYTPLFSTSKINHWRLQLNGLLDAALLEW